MALIKCKECGAQVSNKAKSLPIAVQRYQRALASSVGCL